MLFFTLKENIEKKRTKNEETEWTSQNKSLQPIYVKIKTYHFMAYQFFGISPPLLLSLKFCFLVPLPIYIENETSIYI